jgi:hypothetical protein
LIKIGSKQLATEAKANKETIDDDLSNRKFVPGATFFVAFFGVKDKPT